MQNGFTALYIAAHGGNKECVEALLGGGASVDMWDKVDNVQLNAYGQRPCSVPMCKCKSRVFIVSSITTRT